MKNRIFIFCLSTSLIFLTGCIPKSSVVRFDHQPQDDQIASRGTITPPEHIGIYRTHGPYTQFFEIGLITFRMRGLDIEQIYWQLRKDASLQGAEAVVDTKITDETHEETNTVQKCDSVLECDANGNCTTKDICHTDFVTEEVTTFLATGSLIRSSK